MGSAGLEVATRSDSEERAMAIGRRERVGIAGATTGTVKWVDVARARGAIETDLTDPWEIWFHFSCVDELATQALTVGDRVDVRYLRLDLDGFKYVAHLVRIVPL